ncbi:MAG: bifunctional hydroxymethylpyrimidine kinase/phosphomethylpyrimidine kinase [Eubacteriaceae bacterium]
MKLKPNDLRLYGVTDRKWLEEGDNLEKAVELAIEGGATFIQLREKSLDFEEFVALGKKIKKITDGYNIPFVINDSVEVALACDADGVHVGQSDLTDENIREKIGPNKLLGFSVQTVEQGIKAEAMGGDYLGVGAVFSTSTKLDAADVSHETLKAICEAVNIPVVAIGGINKENVLTLSGTGVNGIAVVSGIFGEKEIKKETQRLRELSNAMVSSNMKKILTIAGSDPSGGAGIQADLKTILAQKMYGMSVITALTAQNTMGVYDVLEITPAFVGKQLDCVFQDILPDAVKIGMVSNPEIIEVIREKLGEYKVEKLVIDPVMVATSGGKLIQNPGIQALVDSLFPLGTLVTPNIPEAECLSGVRIETQEEMEEAAKIISKMTPGGVLIKGGHFGENVDDLLYYQGKTRWFRGKKINNPNSHGTGCTLSSAIACFLGRGETLEKSIEKGKAYITAVLEDGLNLGQGSGPLNHGKLL